jgi:nucleotide-binding universal stress UspA family protein
MQVIARAVAQKRPDMLVMGTHGQSGLLRALIGSVTEEALRTLNVDVLAVPPAGPGLEASNSTIMSGLEA